MIVTATLTEKFQIHIPKKIREKAGILTHGPVTMRADKGRVVIEQKKAQSLSDLAGKYKHLGKVKKIDISRIRDCIDYSDL
jgi:bifunctional DNA-binding transcriptional regulator/antitoxin component of YhaV-PrlF toxin-antitoxin module